ncbi:MAG: metalloregulator ArsR/SmtB family transcription factor [Candidatus Lokiarchaeota archaeon]
MMIENFNTSLIKFLKVLSDPVRLKIIEYLHENPSFPSDIQKELNLSQSYTSHQLKKLTEVGIVTYKRLVKNKEFKIKNKKIFKLISIIKSYIFQSEKAKFQEIKSLEQDTSIPDFKDLF